MKLRIASVGFVVALIVSFIGCRQKAPEASEPAAPAQPSFGLSEQGWLIFTSVGELSRMAAFAASPDKTVAAVTVRSIPIKPDQPPAYEVTVPILSGAPIVETLSVQQNPWDPTLYASLADKLVSHYKLTATQGFKDDALKTLTAFSSNDLMKENRSLSAYLTEHPTDPAAQQTAAVLLGTFSLRENAGWMWDPKLACCRAVSHLALARALRKDATVTDEDALAELLIGLIIDTKADCTNRIADLLKRAAARPELLPWVQASALRNTRDWRLPPTGASGTQLEKVEKFRAFADGADLSLGVNYLKDASPMNDIEFNRIALSVPFGVEMGHMFTAKLLPGELREIATLIELPYPTTKVEFESLVEALDHPPSSVIEPDKDGKNVVQVIDRGMWCTAAERHLCLAIYATWDFMQDKWGVPDEAAKYWSSMEKIFSGLRLYPIIAFAKESRRNENPTYVDRLQTLFVNCPQDVPDFTWARACKATYKNLFPDILQRERNWFTPFIPTGTAYRANSRLGTLPLLLHPGLALLELLYKIAPLQESVVQWYYDAKYPGQDNPQAFEEIAGPLADYATWTISRLATLSDKDPTRKEKALLHLVDIDPDRYANLGDFYLTQHDETKAVGAYQAMEDKANDRVMTSNKVGWLITYYFDHGEKDKALKIAAEAAEVYSFAGLQSYASLLEKMGDLAKAEDYYQKIAERYDDSGLLLGFYTRQVERDASSPYAGKRQALEATFFPHGMLRVSLADFKDKPKQGAYISSNGYGLAPNGLKVGDIIVALDGVKVATAKEYFTVRGLKSTPEMPLIIFRDGKYQEISARAENRRFGCDMDDWKGH
ncbi:hypothetical protein BH09VER1_BH09VER1_16850 [soil metagenome]